MSVEKNQPQIQITLQKMVLAKGVRLEVEENRIRKVMLGNLFVEGCVYLYTYIHIHTHTIVVTSNVVFVP